jgi:hypothetical protein
LNYRVTFDDERDEKLLVEINKASNFMEKWKNLFSENWNKLPQL